MFILGVLPACSRAWARILSTAAILMRDRVNGLGLGLAALLALAAQPDDTAGSIQWSALFEPGVGGAVTSLAVDSRDSSRVFVGGDMLGIGRSADGGKRRTQADANAGLRTCEIAEFTFVICWHLVGTNGALTMGNAFTTVRFGKAPTVVKPGPCEGGSTPAKPTMRPISPALPMRPGPGRGPCLRACRATESCVATTRGRAGEQSTKACPTRT